MKGNLRQLIENQVGEPLDQLADLSKRVGMIERLLMRLRGASLNHITLPEPYNEICKNSCDMYIQAVDSNRYVDRADLQDENELFLALVRFGKITELVKTEYLDKLK